MAKLLMMPKMGFDMEQGKIVRWLKEEGDVLKRGEKVAEIETEKVTIEVETFDDGLLHTIVAKEGEEVPVGQPIAVVSQPGEDVDLQALEVDIKGAGDSGIASPQENSPQIIEVADLQRTPPESGRVRASPLARRLAAEHGLDITRIAGSGPKGRIERRDIESAKAMASQDDPDSSLTPSAEVDSAFEDVELDKMRSAIARAMTQSKPGAPHFYVTMPIDMGAALALRKQLVELAPDEPSEPSVNDMVVRAVAFTLRNVPALNAWYLDGKVRHFHGIHVGVAVSLGQGLVVPVVRNTDKMSIYGLASATKALIERTREGRNRPDDFDGATVTISNMGALSREVEEFSAIINPPQAAILAVSAIIRQPVVRDNELGVADIMRVTLSVDHRVGDGSKAVEFLTEFKRLMEIPPSLLIS